MKYYNKSNEAAIRFDTVSVATFIEDYCPVEIGKELYEKITEKELESGERTQKQYADEKYQRIYGSWSTAKKCEYIKSIMQNQIYTPIILASPRPGHHQNLWANVDGNHRSHVIAEFIQDRFGFTGTWSIDNKVSTHSNTFFSSLSRREKRIFLEKTNIIIGTLTNSKIDLRACFLSINDGEALNPQEKRNAIDCEMSEWTRKIAKDHKELFNACSFKWSKSSDRMGDREIVSKLVMILCGLERKTYCEQNQDDINKFYHSTSPTGIWPEHLELVTNYLNKDLFASLKSLPSTLGNKRITKTQMLFFSILHYHMWKNNPEKLINIDIVSFWEWSCKKISEMITNSESIESKYQQKFDNGEISEEELKSAKASLWHNNMRATHKAPTIKLFIEGIKNEFSNNWEKCYQEFIDSTTPLLFNKEAV